MTSKTTLTLASLALAAALAGCGTTVPLNEAPVESRQVTPAAGGTAGGAGSTGTAPQSQVATVDLARGAGVATAAARTIYFDFDSYIIKDEYKTVVEGHAKALAAARSKRLVVEGHTDERGGSEYNLALGQKRAEAVTKTLVLLGAADNQVEAVSFGKERPAVQGSDEAAWAKNRRAELKDR
jgi:peptidoglycan-associated lipoprotein